MSIQSEITRLAGNVSDALDAIEAKGVTIPSGANSDDLADLIGQISGGGGGTGGIYQDQDGYLVLSPDGGGGGGGGGSSDFSTAEVTFTGTGVEYFYCPVMLDGYLSCGVTMGSQTTEDRKYTVVFTTDGSVNMVLKEATPTEVTGDASYDADEQAIYIWGDCTITITEIPL